MLSNTVVISNHNSIIYLNIYQILIKIYIISSNMHIFIYLNKILANLDLKSSHKLLRKIWDCQGKFVQVRVKQASKTLSKPIAIWKRD